MSKIPVISVVSKSNTGKTTLLEKVIKELKRRGVRVAVIKHDAHSFDIDHPGKDSWRHAQAGADIVVISSPEKIALIEKVEKELKLDEVISRVSNVDIILTEGFRRENKPKIEVYRSEAHRGLLCEPHELIAIASDVPWDLGVPCYHIDDFMGIVGEIERYMKSYNISQGGVTP
ncbi:MAG: molybdopterin-guanine dinucleotide biosynthesis protein B [Peptococcaceae bacterium]|nr:molybdopterin-guanine dinucleotide biosynthesis protein B [Peptococcaceae bacterium]